MVAASLMMVSAAPRSLHRLDHLYEANPTTAIFTPLASPTETIPGQPVYLIPAPSSAFCVFLYPTSPKSYAWLFAMVIMWNPASLRLLTYPGGVLNAKHVLPADSAEHLPTPVSSVSICSRLPIWKSAARKLLTGSKKPLPLFGGSPPGAMPITMSPVAVIVMPSAGPAAAGAEVPPGVAASVPCCAAGAELVAGAGSSPLRNVAAPAVPAPMTSAASAPRMIAVRRPPPFFCGGASPGSGSLRRPARSSG